MYARKPVNRVERSDGDGRPHGHVDPHRLSPPASLLDLQRQAGNRAVVQLLDRRDSPPPRVVQRDPPLGGPVKTTPGAKDAQPAWMKPGSTEPLPGVPAPGYEDPRYLRPWMPVQIPPFHNTHLYTKADKERLKIVARAREKDNVASVGRFLNHYLEAVITITGHYVIAEMREAARTPGPGTFVKFLKFAAGETAEALLGGGIGVFLVKQLSKGALKAITILAEKSAAYAWNDISGADDKTLQDKKLDETQALLNKMVVQVAQSSGQFTEDMVAALDPAEGFDRAFWLGAAPLHDLWRFRIPERFPAADPTALRAVVAGVVAAHAHTGGERTKYDCWGLQCAGDTYHRHEVVLQVKPTPRGASVKMAQLNSSSKVLSQALAGATLRMLPNMAVYVMVEPTPAMNAAVKLMDAFRAPGQATWDEVFAFVAAFPGSGNPGATVVTRTPPDRVTASGGGIDEAMWYYQLATNDYDLSQLASEVVDWQTTAQESTSQVDEDLQTHVADPSGLAGLAHARMANFRDLGARKLINEVLADAKPAPATGKWTKGRSLTRYETTPIDY